MGHYRSEMYDPSDDDPKERQKRALAADEYDRWFYHAFATRRVWEFMSLGMEAYKKKYEIKRSQGPSNRDT